MTYTDYVYEIIKSATEKFDAIYEDYILEIVGCSGLTQLRSDGLIEPCGSVNGRALYVLVERREKR